MKKSLSYILIPIALFIALIIITAPNFSFAQTAEQKKAAENSCSWQCGAGNDVCEKCISDYYKTRKIEVKTPTPATPVNKVVPKTVVKPTAVPPADCPQKYEQDEKGNPAEGLIRCGRKVACEYQIITDDKGNEIELNGNPQGDKAMALHPKDSTGKFTPVIVRIPDKADMCNFNSLMDTVNRIITFLLVLTLPIVAIMFAYAGFTLITAGGESSNARTKAKGIFFNAVIGLLIAFCAYLIIFFILKTLGYDGKWFGF